MKVVRFRGEKEVPTKVLSVVEYPKYDDELRSYYSQSIQILEDIGGKYASHLPGSDDYLCNMSFDEMLEHICWFGADIATHNEKYNKQ